MISLLWSIRTKQKRKEQNNSRITEPKNGLTVTKGKGTGENGREGRDNGGKKKRDIMISMYNMVGGGKGRALQHREDK